MTVRLEPWDKNDFPLLGRLLGDPRIVVLDEGRIVESHVCRHVMNSFARRLFSVTGWLLRLKKPGSAFEYSVANSGDATSAAVISPT